MASLTVGLAKGVASRLPSRLPLGTCGSDKRGYLHVAARLLPSWLPLTFAVSPRETSAGPCSSEL